MEGELLGGAGDVGCCTNAFDFEERMLHGFLAVTRDVESLMAFRSLVYVTLLDSPPPLRTNKVVSEIVEKNWQR